jgi:hypothetical protein
MSHVGGGGGYGVRMTDAPRTHDATAPSVGATGGLPGANAAPRTAQVTPDEIESTVARGDVADVEPDVTRSRDENAPDGTPDRVPDDAPDGVTGDDAEFPETD